MTFLKTLAFAILATGATAPYAATITFEEGPDAGGDARFSVSCDAACEGYFFDATTTSTTLGGLIAKHDTTYGTGTGIAWENSVVSMIDASAGSGTERDMGGVEDVRFYSDATYLLFKTGRAPNVGVLINTSGAGQWYDWDAIRRGGFSHLTEFKAIVAPVPVPASLPLLLGGLGLAAYATRRKSA